jgi:excisionase family DNA binding protein
VPRELLSIRDVCDRYGLSEKTVRRKIKAGLLDAYRCGPRLLKLDAAEVETALMHPVASDANDIEAAITRIVAAAPPLTADQRSRISALLRTGSDMDSRVDHGAA